MKVLHIVSGNLNGGAARGAYWLHIALLKHGVESTLLTNSPITKGDITVVTTTKNKQDKAYNIIRNQCEKLPTLFYRNRKGLIFSTGLIGIDFTKTKLYQETDIVHLHWINDGFVNIKHLSKVKKPIIWTMRDMWPMTGGCHYSMECNNYKTSCGNCVQLGSRSIYDISRLVLQRKIKYLPTSIKVVGISNWLTEQAKVSTLFNRFDVRTIHNCINTSEFFPIDQTVAREILGIETDKKIILVAATNITLFYKGFNKFIDSLKYLDPEKYYLCFLGSLEKETADNLGFPYKNFGFLFDYISLRLVYSCADVFVAPSLMEAFGKTLIESMACGTPVVCFNATGPKDIVTHQLDGYKAEPFEPESLADGIKWLLSTPNYAELSRNARAKVLKNFDSKLVAEKYIDLYEEALSC